MDILGVLLGVPDLVGVLDIVGVLDGETGIQIDAPAVLVYPDGHVPHDVLPGYMENVPARHDTHVVLNVAPVDAEYLPAEQGV